MRWSEFPSWLKFFLASVVGGLFVLGISTYPGNVFYFVALSVVANALLYFGFRDNAIFFDVFIGVFFWLGFWVKLVFRVAFMDGRFFPAGSFDGQASSFDRAVLVSVVGLSGLVLASYFREKMVFKYPASIRSDTQEGLFWLYQKYRKSIIFLFLFFVFFIGAVNIYFGIYQRGELVRTILPFGLNRVVTWLLLFGMAAFVAVILNFEFRLNRKNYWLMVVYSFLEGTISSMSQLSRGMILNSGSILYGAIVQAQRGALKVGRLKFVMVLALFACLFFASAVGVTYVRNHSYVVELIESERYLQMNPAKDEAGSSVPVDVKGWAVKSSLNGVASLFLDRWVGIEGVMAVSSYPRLGWDLWRTGWAEVYDENKLSFYDSNLIESSYKNMNTSKFHFVSLSGVVAFFFYPGSYAFLFVAMLLLGVGAGLLEFFVYKVGGRNVILCSLFGQIIAYRFMSFGYVPAQSYLLFGSIIFNVILLFLADRALQYGRSRSSS